MKTLWVVRAPESPGRPERYIADSLLAGLDRELEDHMLVRQIDPNPARVRDPVAGADFYNSVTYTGHHAKASRMIAQTVKDGDSILFVEGMTPLVPTVRYWTELTQKKVNLFGIFHSSTNCPGDLFSNSYPVMDLERYICGALDTVFVATEYLRSLVLGTRVVRSGLPLPPFTKQTRSHDLCKEVLWTHRWAEDKNVDLFIDLMQLMPDFHFRVLAPQERTKIVTAEQEERLKIVGSRLTWVHCVDRTQYLGNLSATNRRGVFFSCATLETFGYSLLEALWEGYYPVVPSWASYEEMVRPAYRYSFDPFQLKDKTYRNKLLKRIEGRIRTAVGRTHPPTIADDFLVPRFVQRYGKPSSVIAEYIMAKESE